MLYIERGVPMRKKLNLISSFIVVVLIFNLASPNYLYAYSISTASHSADIVPRTKISNLTNFKNLMQVAANNLQSEITLTVTNSDINAYSTVISTLTGINSYHISLSQHSTGNTLSISLKYKQAYRLTQALQNTAIYKKLTKSDLILLEFAQSIISKIVSPTMSDYEKVLTIHDYIINTTTYDYDRLNNGTIPDSSYTAAGVLMNKIGVCEGYSEATKLLLNLIGIECEIVTGTASNNVAHAWNIIKLDEEWYMLDTTYDDPITFDNGKRVETLSYDYFNVTSSILRKDHSWDMSKWPTANGTKYNYFVYSNRVVHNYNEFKAYVIKEIKAGSREIICYTQNYNTTYDLSFIFNYYGGKVKYFAPSTTSGSFKILLS